MAAYNYQPVYGIEPYLSKGVPVADAFGGGAEVTNDNLLISLWTVTTLTVGVPTAGQLIKPYRDTAEGAATLAALDSAGATDAYKGFAPLFNSRYTSRFFLTQGDEEGFSVTDFAFALLQPPQDFKNLVLNSVKSIKLDPSKSTGANLTYQGPFLPTNAWFFSSQNADQTPRPESCIFSGPIAYYKTNGANGVFPEPFPASTPQDVVDFVQQVMDGDFYVGAYFSVDDNAGAGVFNFSWPGSNARR